MFTPLKYLHVAAGIEDRLCYDCAIDPRVAPRGRAAWPCRVVAPRSASAPLDATSLLPTSVRDSREGAQELDEDLNDDPNLAIFRQSDNGVLVRMALFALILDVADQVDDYSKPVNWSTERRF